MRALLLQPDDRGRDTGIGRYARALYDHLPDWIQTNDTNDPEIQLGPLRLGGHLRRWWRNLLKPLGDHDVIHATSIAQFHRNANILTVHDTFAMEDPAAYGAAGKLWRLFKHRLPRLDAILCASWTTASALHHHLPTIDPAKLHVAHLGIDHDTFHPTGATTRERACLIVGDLRPRKRSLETLHACHLLDLPLWWAGPRKPWDPYQQRFLQEANTLGVDLTHHGYTTDQDLAHLYQTAGVLAYPSRAEGFGLPPIEAAACGLTTVTSHHPIFTETLRGHTIHAGHHATPGLLTPDEIADALHTALTTPLPADALTRHAQKYTWANTAKATLETYQDVTHP